jgi:hypothetical protein
MLRSVSNGNKEPLLPILTLKKLMALNWTIVNRKHGKLDRQREAPTLATANSALLVRRQNTFSDLLSSDDTIRPVCSVVANQKIQSARKLPQHFASHIDQTGLINQMQAWSAAPAGSISRG